MGKPLFSPQEPDDRHTPEPSLREKLTWFFLLAGASVAVVASAAYFLRALLFIG